MHLPVKTSTSKGRTDQTMAKQDCAEDTRVRNQVSCFHQLYLEFQSSSAENTHASSSTLSYKLLHLLDEQTHTLRPLPCISSYSYCPYLFWGVRRPTPCVTWGVLDPQPGIELMPSAMEAWHSPRLSCYPRNARCTLLPLFPPERCDLTVGPMKLQEQPERVQSDS